MDPVLKGIYIPQPGLLVWTEQSSLGTPKVHVLEEKEAISLGITIVLIRHALLLEDYLIGLLALLDAQKQAQKQIEACVADKAESLIKLSR